MRGQLPILQSHFKVVQENRVYMYEVQLRTYFLSATKSAPNTRIHFREPDIKSYQRRTSRLVEQI
jgi:hypothetical protein